MLVCGGRGFLAPLLGSGSHQDREGNKTWTWLCWRRWETRKLMEQKASAWQDGRRGGRNRSCWPVLCSSPQDGNAVEGGFSKVNLCGPRTGTDSDSTSWTKEGLMGPAKARIRSLDSAHSLISDGGDKGDSGGHYWQKAWTLAQALPLTAAYKQ